MKLLFALIGASLSFCAWSTNSDYKLGEVTESELKESSCPIDAEAHAYYHFDVGSAELYITHSGVETRQERKLKLKVVDDQGVNSGDFVIHLRNHQDIRAIKGYTYTMENGEVERFKLKKDNIHEERIHDYLRKVSINMPRVQAGSIIELEYITMSDYLGELPKWGFQKTIPVMYSEYTTYEHIDFEYRLNYRGYLPIKRSETLRQQRQIGDGQAEVFITSYTLDSVPAFKEEKFLTAPENFMSAIEFSLVATTFAKSNVRNFGRTWQDVDKLYKDYRYFGGFLEKQKQGKKILQSIGLEAKTPEERIRELYSFLQYRMNWNKYQTDFAKRDPLEVYQENEGDAGELNLLLTLLLQADGIDAEPVLVSTRSNGFVFQAMPDDRYFNHVIVKANLGEEALFLDLTSSTTTAGQIPYKNLNGNARLPYSGKFETIQPSGDYSEQKIYMVNIEGSELKGQMMYKAKDYAALDHLEEYENLDNQACLNVLRKKYPDAELSNFKAGRSNSLQSSYQLELSSKGNIQKIDNELFVKPFPLEDMENPFTEESRNYPIDFGYTVSLQKMCTINTPEGYEVSHLPEPAQVYLADKRGVLMYQALEVGSAIQVNFSLKINSAFFEVEQYPYLQQFYGMAIDKLNENITLKKKS